MIKYDTDVRIAERIEGDVHTLCKDTAQLLVQVYSKLREEDYGSAQVFKSFVETVLDDYEDACVIWEVEDAAEARKEARRGKGRRLPS